MPKYYELQSRDDQQSRRGGLPTPMQDDTVVFINRKATSESLALRSKALGILELCRDERNILALFSSGHYQEAGIVSFFMQMGQIIEARTAEGALASIHSLIKLTPTKARRVS